ncbi:MAG: LLM class flavin-dependent oxidoreductase [Candidatus Helarchaeota archaeon]
MVKFSVHHATNFTNLGFGREEVLRSIGIVEKLGCYDMNTVQCHINWYPNEAEVFSSWIMAAEMANHTKRTNIGIMVTDVFRTHPAQMALNALHLQRLSNGRFILGLGAGEGANLTNFGISWEKAVSHLEEAVQYLKLLFQSSPKNKVQFEGNYFKLNNVFLQMPAKIPPKIWLAAGSPRTLKITAQYADGWIPVGSTPKLYKKQLKIINSEGRKIEKAYNAFTYISKKDPDKAKEFMDVIGSVQCMRPEICEEFNVTVPEKIDFIKHFKLPLRKQKSHTAKALGFAQKHIPIEIRMQPILAGSPDEIIEQVEEWRKAGCENLVLQFWGDDYWNSLKLFADEVVPHFKD